MLFGQRIFKQIAEQLHRHVLECQGRAVGQLKDMQARRQRAQRRDLRGVGTRARIVIDLGSVSLVHDGLEVICRNVGCKLGQHFIRQISIGQ